MQERKNNIVIRTAVVDDAESLLDIYSYYVTDTAITFEYEVPSINEFAGRIMNKIEKYPYLVALSDDKVVGYAYAGPFNIPSEISHLLKKTCMKRIKKKQAVL